MLPDKQAKDRLKADKALEIAPPAPSSDFDAMLAFKSMMLTREQIKMNGFPYVVTAKEAALEQRAKAKRQKKLKGHDRRAPKRKAIATGEKREASKMVELGARASTQPKVGGSKRRRRSLARGDTPGDASTNKGGLRSDEANNSLETDPSKPTEQAVVVPVVEQQGQRGAPPEKEAPGHATAGEEAEGESDSSADIESEEEEVEGEAKEGEKQAGGEGTGSDNDDDAEEIEEEEEEEAQEGDDEDKELEVVDEAEATSDKDVSESDDDESDVEKVCLAIPHRAPMYLCMSPSPLTLAPSCGQTDRKRSRTGDMPPSSPVLPSKPSLTAVEEGAAGPASPPPAPSHDSASRSQTDSREKKAQAPPLEPEAEEPEDLMKTPIIHVGIGDSIGESKRATLERAAPKPMSDLAHSVPFVRERNGCCRKRARKGKERGGGRDNAWSDLSILPFGSA